MRRLTTRAVAGALESARDIRRHARRHGYQEGWWRPDDALSALRRQVGANHRMLSTYLNALRRHDLCLADIVEPPPSDQWAADRPDCKRQPLYLVVRCTRQ